MVPTAAVPLATSLGVWSLAMTSYSEQPISATGHFLSLSPPTQAYSCIPKAGLGSLGRVSPDGLVSCCDTSQTPTQPESSCSHYYILQPAMPLRWHVVSVAAPSCQSESPASLLELLQALVFAAFKEEEVCLPHRVATEMK